MNTKYIEQYDNIRNKSFKDIKTLTEKLKGELFIAKDFYTYIKYKEDNKDKEYVIYDKRLKDKCAQCLTEFSEEYLIECKICNSNLCRKCYRDKNHKLNCKE